MLEILESAVRQPILPWAFRASVEQHREAQKKACLPVQPQQRDPKHFWPDQAGELQSLKRILAPLEPLRQHVLTLQGIDNRIKGDGDGHMRGIGCLLTGIELFPGDAKEVPTHQQGGQWESRWTSTSKIDFKKTQRLKQVRIT